MARFTLITSCWTRTVEIKRDKRVPGRVAQRDGDITRGGNLKL